MVIVQKSLVTALAGASLIVFEVWILALLFMLLGILFTFASSTLFSKCPPDDDFAAEHPWRYHVAHTVFWGEKVVSALLLLGLSLWTVWLFSKWFPDAAFWYVLYIEAFLLSFQFFPNDANSLVLVSAMSYRLRGKQSNVRGRPQAGTMGPIFLEPISVKRHRW